MIWSCPSIPFLNHMDKLAIAAVVAVLATAAVLPWFWTVTNFLLVTLLSVLLGVSSAIWAHLYLSSDYQTPPGLYEKLDRDLQEFRDRIKNESLRLAKPPFAQQQHLAVVFGRTVDGLLQQLIEFALRDFVFVWLKEYAHQPEMIIDQFKEDLWVAVQDLYERMSRINTDKLIACNMMNKITLHFEKIRIAQTTALETNKPAVFTVFPYLMSEKSEIKYLRQISELLIMFLLPRCYSLPPATYLLREILASKIFYPTIQMITEPDYLNQKILNYLEAQNAAAAVHTRTLEYAKSFEDFLRMIQTCNEIHRLKQIRYNIVAEIMQATTLQNVNRARGMEVDDGIDNASITGSRTNTTNSSGGRRQIAAARKLKKYISQLSCAKEQCEQKLTALGWDGLFPTHDVNNVKILPLSQILESVVGRRHLSIYLETVCSQGLVGFWVAVEELKTSRRCNWHQLGAEIFYTYIRSPTAEIKVDRETRRRMEAFLLGDKGPEVFYEVQQMVINTLQNKYYQSFLLSDDYKRLVKALDDEEEKEKQRIDKSPMEERQYSGDSSSSNECSLNMGDHSSYARKKLDHLHERLNNKTQALEALKASLKPESKLLEILQKEVIALKEERFRVEAHLSRAHAWAQNLGKWRATVYSTEIDPETQIPRFVLVVHIDETICEEADAISTGWVILRTLHHFQDLHKKLRPLCAEIKNLELPSNSFKFLFSKNDKNSLDKAKNQIQKYLEFILEDEHLNQSEAIYAFLSPSSDHLKSNTLSPKKSRFSFSTLFKSSNDSNNSQNSQERPTIRESEDDDISLYLDGESGDIGVKSTVSGNKNILGMQMGSGDDGKDSIAEPLYALMGEVFDMKGVFRWLRKTLISFVQITYGRTINRQIRDTITWVFSEPMLHYYLSILLKSWWPGGVLAKPGEERSQRLKEKTRESARRQFIENVPEVLNSLVGAQSAQRGAQKIFDTLQNHMLNKQLFYDQFESVLIHVFPELRQHM